MEVLFCFDTNYEQHFGVAATSLLTNNSQFVSKINLITDKANEELRSKLDRLSQTYETEFEIYEVDPKSIADLKVSHHISTAAYYRLLATEILPQELDRVLYLDSDLIVVSSLENLFKTKLEDYYLAAVGSRVQTTGARLQLKNNLYFNSGVMLINLELWREKNIGDRAIEFAKNNPELIKLWDQDSLNKVIDGKFIVLEKKWNYLIDLYSENASLDDRAAIFHFVGSLKPWHLWCLDSRKNIYWDYLKQSLWSERKPQKPKNFKEILKAIKVILVFWQKKINNFRFSSG